MQQSKCHACNSTDVKLISGFDSLFTVSSDCKPWKTGYDLCVCEKCGILQKLITDEFDKNCEIIYKNYSVYFQSSGKEQLVFDQKNGGSNPRSQRVVRAIKDSVPLSNSGQLLDFGCGNGNFLHSFGSEFQGWSLSGLEIDRKYEKEILEIEHADEFYTGNIEDVPDSFDIISMIHSLEHIKNPTSILSKIHEKLIENGLLIVQVPNYLENPFDLLIADHCSHFSEPTLNHSIIKAGFEILSSFTDVIPKEIVVVAIKRTNIQNCIDSPMNSEAGENAEQLIIWMKRLISYGQSVSPNHEMGVFGTSIAGTWFASHLKGKVAFFVDEDPDRVGKKHMGLPVYHPDDTPKNSQVVIALPHTIAIEIQARLNKKGDIYLIPEPLPI